jgi:Phosphate-starvation-inducible E family
MVEERLRRRFDYYLGKTEIVIYSVLALMLAVTAFVTIATAGQILWIGLSHWTVAAQTLRVLNQLLIVLILVGILHTLGFSIRSHALVIEPFLMVGLIASIRSVLVITLEAATLTKEGAWATEGSSAIFHSSMIELGLLGLLILVLVVSIHFCVAALPDRRSRRNSEVQLLFPQGCVRMPLFTAKSNDSAWTVAIRSGGMRAVSIFSSPMPAHNC